jgi:hypothetical protein
MVAYSFPLRFFLSIASVVVALSGRDSAAQAPAREIVSLRTDLSAELSADEMKSLQLKTCIQPSYDAWEAVKKGMTLDEVRKLLGEPLEMTRPATEAGALLRDAQGQQTDAQVAAEAKAIKAAAEEGVLYAGRMIYGRIEFDSPVMPHSYNFEIIYVNDRVFEKWTRFRGSLSESDKPSTPVLVSPHFNAHIASTQDIVDLRWAPSSGAYPIQYDVEVQSYLGDDPPSWRDLQDNANYETVDDFRDLQIPHAAISSPGGITRWRVRAKNKHGESDWSEWRQLQTLESGHFKTLLLQQLPALYD